MSDRTTVPTTAARHGWAARAALVTLALAGVGVATGFWVMKRGEGDTPAGPKPEPGAKPGTVGGVPLFTGWPQQQRPDVAVVLTGQTYGYLSPCGCSRPQKGGLERRYNFMNDLRAKGWPVIGLDLGDVAPPAGKGVQKQNLLKYRTAVKALTEMGYVAVGLGEYDFNAQLFELIGELLNMPGEPPVVLAGNLVGVQRGGDGKPVKTFPREQFFPGGRGDAPMVQGHTVSVAEGRPPVGVVSVIGPTVWQKVEKIDSQFGFQDNAAVVAAALKELGAHPAKPELRVLLYQGTLDEAKAAAEAYPQFQAVVCLSEDSEPPQFPTPANGGKTLIIQVGHKGQNVGVLGAFKTDTGFELKYQLVPLGEEYLTPEGPQAAAQNRVLQMLEEYTAEVKKQNLLALFTARPLQHPGQIQNPGANLSYVGSDRCAGCHPSEFAIWQKAKHAHAYDALVHAARPGNRQFDGECVVCHTTGFEYQTGFTDAEATPFLMHNGCENCHGPGSGHATNPTHKPFLAAMTPWKSKPEDRLPDRKTLEEIAKKGPIERGGVNLPPEQVRVMNAVRGMCMKCHDGENDPKFDFEKYFPEIYHSGHKAVAAK